MSSVRNQAVCTPAAAERQLFPASGVWRTALFALLFLVALVVRVQGIDSVPMDVNAVKQYRSAMVARAMYYRAIPDVPGWKMEVAEADVRELGELVPPVTEAIAALAYRVVGGEVLVIPRMVSVLAWLIGGVFLSLIARRVVNADAALIALAFYLMLPAAVAESRSFQPDPPMIGAMLASLYAIVRHHESETWRSLLVAAGLSALAILLKGIAAFFTVGAFVGLALARGENRRLATPRALAFVLISIVPTASFYLLVMSRGTIGGHSFTGFAPNLLLRPEFYQGWLGMINKTTGLAALVASLVGLLVLPRDHRRGFLLGLWVAYGVYGIVKTYHIHTHPYYQLPFIPIVALSLGAALSVTTGWLAEHRSTPIFRLGALGILVFGVLLGIGFDIQRRRNLPDFDAEVRIAEVIGQKVNHSTRTILLAEYSGRPLRYHGHFSGTYWPDIGEIQSESVVGLEALTVPRRLERLVRGQDAEYFVVRDLAQFELQDELRQLLRATHPVLAETAEYVIFDLRRRLPDG